MDNTNEDFKVIISDLDQSTVLVTEQDEQMSVDDMWKQILETSVYNFQTKKHQYTTIIHNSSSGTADNITVENIEEYADNPQNNLSTIQTINKIIKAFVNKDDAIGRVYECIQMYTNPSYDLIYNINDEQEKNNDDISEINALIENFNKQVNIKKFLKDGVPTSYLDGTYITYLRNTKENNYVIDTYPIGIVEISEFMIDGEPLVLFNVSALRQKLKHTSRKNRKNKEILFKDLEDIVKNNYPEEVYKAYKNNEKYAILDQKRVGVVRVNSLDGLYGLSPIFKALKPAIVVNNIEASDDSTVKARGKKIIHQKLRKEVAGTDYNKQAYNEMAYAHENLISAWKNKTVLVTTPWYVESIAYVEPKADTTNKDTLNTYRNKEFTALGISFLDTYNATLDVSKISLDGLMRYIDLIVAQFTDIINKYYKVLLENNGKDVLLCPEIQIKCSELLSIETKKSLAEFIFTKLGGSFETAYNILGVSSADTEAKRRLEEKDKGYEETFIPHSNFYTQNGDNTTDNQAGRPQGEDTKKRQYDEIRNDLKSKGGGVDV